MSRNEWREEQDWPLTEVTLGSTTYTRDQCLTIMNEDIGNNGLIAIAQQEIAAKLNVANGAAHECIDKEMIQAELLIADLVVPPFGDGFIPLGNVQDLVNDLARYNKGEDCCAEHCTL